MQPKIRTSLSLVLCAVYFFGNVLLAHASENNFWKERQRAIEHQPQQLAALPSLTLPPITPALKFPSAVASGLVPHETVSPQVQEVLRSLSASRVRLQKVFSPRNTQSPIVLVQDVHLNTEAQKNISATLESILEAAPSTIIGVEGAFSSFDFSRLRAFPDQSIVKRVADSFLEQNFISAASYTGLTHASTIASMNGVDDERAHQQNVAAYREANRVRHQVEENLTKQDLELEQQERSGLSGLEQRFTTLRKNYTRETIGLGEYLRELKSLSHEAIQSAAIENFLTASDLERTINYQQADAEKSAILERLVKALSDQERADLLALSVGYKMGRLSFGNYFGSIERLLNRHHIDLRHSPAFSSYLRYVALADGIDLNRITRDVKAWEEKIEASISANPTHRALINDRRQFELLRKMVRFELSPEEWTELSTDRQANSATEQERILKSFFDFYRLADERSALMIKNLTACSQNRTASKECLTVLIAGGFHTQVITQELRKKNVPFIVVSPNVTKADGKSASAYLSAFDRDKTPLDKLFAGEKLFLAPAELAAGSHDAPSQPTTRKIAATVAALSLAAHLSIPSTTNVEAGSSNHVSEIHFTDSPELTIDTAINSVPFGYRSQGFIQVGDDKVNFLTPISLLAFAGSLLHRRKKQNSLVWTQIAFDNQKLVQEMRESRVRVYAVTNKIVACFENPKTHEPAYLVDAGNDHAMHLMLLAPNGDSLAETHGKYTDDLEVIKLDVYAEQLGLARTMLSWLFHDAKRKFPQSPYPLRLAKVHNWAIVNLAADLFGADGVQMLDPASRKSFFLSHLPSSVLETFGPFQIKKENFRGNRIITLRSSDFSTVNTFLTDDVRVEFQSPRLEFFARATNERLPTFGTRTEVQLQVKANALPDDQSWIPAAVLAALIISPALISLMTHSLYPLFAYGVMTLAAVDFGAFGATEEMRESKQKVFEQFQYLNKLLLQPQKDPVKIDELRTQILLLQCAAYRVQHAKNSFAYGFFRPELTASREQKTINAPNPESAALTEGLIYTATPDLKLLFTEDHLPSGVGATRFPHEYGTIYFRNGSPAPAIVVFKSSSFNNAARSKRAKFIFVHQSASEGSFEPYFEWTDGPSLDSVSEIWLDVDSFNFWRSGSSSGQSSALAEPALQRLKSLFAQGRIKMVPGLKKFQEDSEETYLQTFMLIGKYMDSRGLFRQVPRIVDTAKEESPVTTQAPLRKPLVTLKDIGKHFPLFLLLVPAAVALFFHSPYPLTIYAAALLFAADNAGQPDLPPHWKKEWPVPTHEEERQMTEAMNRAMHHLGKSVGANLMQRAPLFAVARYVRTLYYLHPIAAALLILSVPKLHGDLSAILLAEEIEKDILLSLLNLALKLMRESGRDISPTISWQGQTRNVSIQTDSFVQLFSYLTDVAELLAQSLTEENRIELIRLAKKEIANYETIDHRDGLLKIVSALEHPTPKVPAHWKREWPDPSPEELERARNLIHEWPQRDGRPRQWGGNALTSIDAGKGTEEKARTLRAIYYLSREAAIIFFITVDINHGTLRQILQSNEIETEILVDIANEAFHQRTLHQTEFEKTGLAGYTFPNGSARVFSYLRPEFCGSILNGLKPDALAMFINSAAYIMAGEMNGELNMNLLNSAGLITEDQWKAVDSSLSAEARTTFVRPAPEIQKSDSAKHWNPKWKDPTPDELAEAKSVLASLEEKYRQEGKPIMAGELFMQPDSENFEFLEHKARVFSALYYLNPDAAALLLASLKIHGTLVKAFEAASIHPSFIASVFKHTYELWFDAARMNNFLLFKVPDDSFDNALGFLKYMKDDEYGLLLATLGDQGSHEIMDYLVGLLAGHSDHAKAALTMMPERWLSRLSAPLRTSQRGVLELEGIFEISKDIHKHIDAEESSEEKELLTQWPSKKNNSPEINPEILSKWSGTDWSGSKRNHAGETLGLINSNSLIAAEPFVDENLRAKPKPVRYANKIIPMLPGRAIGRLVLLRGEYAREMMNKYPRDIILALDALGTSHVDIGPFRGIITFVENDTSKHAYNRAFVWKVPHAIFPGPASLEQYDGKWVVFDVSPDLKKAIIELYDPAKHGPIPEFKLPKVDLPPSRWEEKLILTGDDPALRDPAVVSYKMAEIAQLTDNLPTVNDPTIHIRPAKLTALPFHTFNYLWQQNGPAPFTLNELHTKLESATTDEASRLLEKAIHYIESWKTSYVEDMGGQLPWHSVFVRDLINAADLPDHPGVGSGLYLTVQNVRHPETLKAIAKVYASRFFPRAYFDRRKYQINERDVQMAIGLVDTERADYSFVINTSDVFSNKPQHMQMSIEQGQGESIVGDDERLDGPATQMVWDKDTQRLIEKTASKKRYIAVLDPDGGTKIIYRDAAKEFLNQPNRDRISAALFEIGMQLEARKGPRQIEGVLRMEADGTITVVLLQNKSLAQKIAAQTTNVTQQIAVVAALLFPAAFSLYLHSAYPLFAYALFSLMAVDPMIPWSVSASEKATKEKLAIDDLARVSEAELKSRGFDPVEIYAIRIFVRAHFGTDIQSPRDTLALPNDLEQTTNLTDRMRCAKAIIRLEQVFSMIAGNFRVLAMEPSILRSLRQAQRKLFNAEYTAALVELIRLNKSMKSAVESLGTSDSVTLARARGLITETLRLVNQTAVPEPLLSAIRNPIPGYIRSGKPGLKEVIRTELGVAQASLVTRLVALNQDDLMVLEEAWPFRDPIRLDSLRSIIEQGQTQRFVHAGLKIGRAPHVIEEPERAAAALRPVEWASILRFVAALQKTEFSEVHGGRWPVLKSFYRKIGPGFWGYSLAPTVIESLLFVGSGVTFSSLIWHSLTQHSPPLFWLVAAFQFAWHLIHLERAFSHEKLLISTFTLLAVGLHIPLPIAVTIPHLLINSFYTGIEILHREKLQQIDLVNGIFATDLDFTIWEGFPVEDQVAFYARLANGDQSPNVDELSEARDYIANHNGLNTHLMLEKWLTMHHVNRTDYAELTRQLRDKYEATIRNKRLDDPKHLIAGVRKFLEQVKAGVEQDKEGRRNRIFVLTGAKVSKRLPLLRALGLGHLFNEQNVIGEGHKGERLKELMSRYGLKSNQVVMIGDSPIDIQAGLEVGALTIGIARTAGDRARLEAAGADIIIANNYLDLISLLVTLKLPVAGAYGKLLQLGRVINNYLPGRSQAWDIAIPKARTASEKFGHFAIFVTASATLLATASGLILGNFQGVGVSILTATLCAILIDAGGQYWRRDKIDVGQTLLFAALFGVINGYLIFEAYTWMTPMGITARWLLSWLYSVFITVVNFWIIFFMHRLVFFNQPSLRAPEFAGRELFSKLKDVISFAGLVHFFRHLMVQSIGTTPTSRALLALTSGAIVGVFVSAMVNGRDGFLSKTIKRQTVQLSRIFIFLWIDLGKGLSLRDQQRLLKLVLQVPPRQRTSLADMARILIRIIEHHPDEFQFIEMLSDTAVRTSNENAAVKEAVIDELFRSHSHANRMVLERLIGDFRARLSPEEKSEWQHLQREMDTVVRDAQRQLLGINGHVPYNMFDRMHALRLEAERLHPVFGARCFYEEAVLLGQFGLHLHDPHLLSRAVRLLNEKTFPRLQYFMRAGVSRSLISEIQEVQMLAALALPNLQVELEQTNEASSAWHVVIENLSIVTGVAIVAMLGIALGAGSHPSSLVVAAAVGILSLGMTDNPQHSSNSTTKPIPPRSSVVFSNPELGFTDQVRATLDQHFAALSPSSKITVILPMTARLSHRRLMDPLSSPRYKSHQTVNDYSRELSAFLNLAANDVRMTRLEDLLTAIDLMQRPDIAEEATTLNFQSASFIAAAHTFAQSQDPQVRSYFQQIRDERKAFLLLIHLSKLSNYLLTKSVAEYLLQKKREGFSDVELTWEKSEPDSVREEARSIVCYLNAQYEFGRGNLEGFNRWIDNGLRAMADFLSRRSRDLFYSQARHLIRDGRSPVIIASPLLANRVPPDLKVDFHSATPEEPNPTDELVVAWESDKPLAAQSLRVQDLALRHALYTALRDAEPAAGFDDRTVEKLSSQLSYDVTPTDIQKIFPVLRRFPDVHMLLAFIASIPNAQVQKDLDLFFSAVGQLRADLPTLPAEEPSVDPKIKIPTVIEPAKPIKQAAPKPVRPKDPELAKQFDYEQAIASDPHRAELEEKLWKEIENAFSVIGSLQYQYLISILYLKRQDLPVANGTIEAIFERIVEEWPGAAPHVREKLKNSKVRATKLQLAWLLASGELTGKTEQEFYSLIKSEIDHIFHATDVLVAVRNKIPVFPTTAPLGVEQAASVPTTAEPETATAIASDISALEKLSGDNLTPERISRYKESLKSVLTPEEYALFVGSLDQLLDQHIKEREATYLIVNGKSIDEISKLAQPYLSRVNATRPLILVSFSPDNVSADLAKLPNVARLISKRVVQIVNGKECATIMDAVAASQVEDNPAGIISGGASVKKHVIVPESVHVQTDFFAVMPFIMTQWNVHIYLVLTQIALAIEVPLRLSKDFDSARRALIQA